MTATPEKRGGGKGRGPFHCNSRYHRRCERTRSKMRARFATYQFGKCARCGVSFVPGWNDTLQKFDSFCPRCQIKNLADAFDIPEMRDLAGIPREEP